jgi:hypothetical protein
MSKAKWNDLFIKDEQQEEQKVVRPGTCGNCGQASFKLAIVKHHLLRACKSCKEVIDTENMKVVRKGKQYETR